MTACYTSLLMALKRYNSQAVPYFHQPQPQTYDRGPCKWVRHAEEYDSQPALLINYVHAPPCTCTGLPSRLTTRRRGRSAKLASGRTLHLSGPVLGHAVTNIVTMLVIVTLWCVTPCYCFTCNSKALHGAWCMLSIASTWLPTC